MPQYWEQAERDGVNLKADVYPYTFWASTIRVIVLDRDFTNPDKVAKAIADNGGPDAIRFTRYDPDPSIVDLTLEQVARQVEDDARRGLHEDRAARRCPTRIRARRPRNR